MLDLPFISLFSIISTKVDVPPVLKSDVGCESTTQKCVAFHVLPLYMQCIETPTHSHTLHTTVSLRYRQSISELRTGPLHWRNNDFGTKVDTFLFAFDD